MSSEQYNELKKNGTVTGNGYTIEDEENALNITPDTSEEQLVEVKQDVDDLKANAKKTYLHSFKLSLEDGLTLFMNVYSSKATQYSSLVEVGDAINATYDGTHEGSVFYPCFLSVSGADVNPCGIVRIQNDTQALLCVNGGVNQYNITGFESGSYRIKKFKGD